MWLPKIEKIPNQTISNQGSDALKKKHDSEPFLTVISVLGAPDRIHV